MAHAPISAFPFHHANAYEEEDSATLVLDAVGWDSVDFDSQAPDFFLKSNAALIRVRVDMRDGNGRVCSAKRLTSAESTLEFPSVHPRFVGKRHSVIYCVYDSARAIARIRVTDRGDDAIETDVWYAGHRRFCAEPTVVSKSGAVAEDDAWIVMGVHDVDSADIVVFDASRPLARGPIATLHLPHRLPLSFHGTFCRAIV